MGKTENVDSDELSNCLKLDIGHTKVLDDLAQAAECHQKHVEPSHERSLLFRLDVRDHGSGLRIHRLAFCETILCSLLAIAEPHRECGVLSVC